MMKLIPRYLAGWVAVLLLVVASPAYVVAQDNLEAICNEGNNASSALCKDYLQSKDTSNQKDNKVLVLIRNIVSLMSYIAGALAVFMVIFGGFKYITSAGEPAKTVAARQTILFALIGMVVIVVSRQLILYILGKIG